MLILLYGEDTYRSRQKLKEIVEKYKAKHQSGLNLVRFSNSEMNLDKIKEKIESVSMFDEKKLILLENPFQNSDFSEKLLEYTKKNKLKDNQDIILVILQEGKLAISKIKSKFSMLEEFPPLKDLFLTHWVKKEIEKNNSKISQSALRKLIVYTGNNLWQMNSEIGKLVSYAKGKEIQEEDIDLLINTNLETDIFKTIDALARKDKKTAFNFLHKHLEKGDDQFYLLSMFVYQFRTLIKLKDLIERGVPYYSLAKESGLHPYVVKKSSDQLRNFSIDSLKKIYRRLLDIDSKLKVGQIDGPTALDLLIAEV